MDTVLPSANEEEHLSNLEEELHKLQTHGVRVKKERCHFLQSNVQYLGHMIDSESIHATDTKLKAIVEAPKPRIFMN